MCSYHNVNTLTLYNRLRFCRPQHQKNKQVQKPRHQRARRKLISNLGLQDQGRAKRLTWTDDLSDARTPAGCPLGSTRVPTERTEQQPGAATLRPAADPTKHASQLAWASQLRQRSTAARGGEGDWNGSSCLAWSVGSFWLLPNAKARTGRRKRGDLS
jgi:hypothetical protein